MRRSTAAISVIPDHCCDVDAILSFSARMGVTEMRSAVKRVMVRKCVIIVAIDFDTIDLLIAFN